jgi:hypothetical protein
MERLQCESADVFAVVEHCSVGQSAYHLPVLHKGMARLKCSIVRVPSIPFRELKIV